MAYVSRELDVHSGGKARRQEVGAGNDLITFQPHTKLRELEPEVGRGYQLSKPVPGGVLPPARLPS